MLSARDGVGNDLTGKGSSLLTITTESAYSTNQMRECDDANAEINAFFFVSQKDTSLKLADFWLIKYNFIWHLCTYYSNLFIELNIAL